MNSQTIKYRPDIDGLRAFAVLSVVIFHAFPSFLSGGFIGVDIFFVISGFLITNHIIKKLDEGTFSFIDFFWRRIRRIFPALTLVMVSSLAFGWFTLLNDEFVQLGKHVASGAAFILNFTIVSESGYFDNASETKPMLHLWSLAVEEQFYILWPLTVWLAWKQKINILIIIISVAICSFFLNIWFVKTHPIETFFWSVSRFWELLSGSALAWTMINFQKLNSWDYIKNVTKSENFEINKLLITNGMALTGIILLVYGNLYIDENLNFPSGWALVPVSGAVLIIAAGPSTAINRVILMNRLAVWLGLISYPLYLWHWPILSFIQIIDGKFPHRDQRILAVILSILLAWLTFKFIESPIRFSKIKRKTLAIFITSLLVLIGVFGFFISRYDWSQTNQQQRLAFRKNSMEHSIGSSSSWFVGKEDWLFLGNSHENTIAKLKVSTPPDNTEIDAQEQFFSELSKQAFKNETKIAVLIGPNKASIYPEYLPDGLEPSSKRYVSFFTDKLKNIPNLVVYDPTEDLLQLKESEGNLYYRTDTHWNAKGAFLAYLNFSQLLNVPTPNVHFQLGDSYQGDLIKISGQKGFDLHKDDNWQFTIDDQKHVVRTNSQKNYEPAFGAIEVVDNPNALSSLSIWVVGDSFTHALRPYFNATFKQVNYLGHLSAKLDNLQADLETIDNKPDLIIIIKVERSF